MNLCRIGIFKRTTLLSVSAHRIEVTDESIPPETPTTKPDIPERSQYAFSQETMCDFTLFNE